MATEIEIPDSLLPPLKEALALLEKHSEDAPALTSALQMLGDIVEDEAFVEAGAGFRAMVLSVHAAGYEMRYRLTGNIDDLDGQIDNLQLELELIPEGTPEHASKSTHLAGRLIDREARNGDALDLSQATTLLRQVTRPGAPEFPDLLAAKINLGSALQSQYERYGDPADLEEAIETLEQVCAGVESGDPQEAVAWAMFGRVTFDRFRLSNRMTDLDDAIIRLRRATDLSPEGDPRRAQRLLNLGAALGEKIKRDGSSEELDESIAILEEASRLGATDQNRAVFLGNLALAYQLRARQNADASELDLAVGRAREAVELSNRNSTHRLGVLWILAESLVERFGNTGKVTDLEAAIDAWEELETSKEALATAMSLPEALQMGLRWAGTLPAVFETYWAYSNNLATGDAAAIRRRIVEVAEGNKAPLLTTLVGRARMLAPDSIAPATVARERELLDEIARLDTAELATRGELRRELESVQGASAVQIPEGYINSPSWVGAISAMLQTPESRIRMRADAFEELDDLWSAIAASDPQGEAYVSLRRLARPTWKQIADIAAGLPSGTTLLLFAVTAQRTLVYVLSGDAETVVLESDLADSDWRDAALQLYDEMREGVPFAEQRWMSRLEALLDLVRPHVKDAGRVLIVPSGAAHLIPWAVAFREAGITGTNGQSISLVMLPTLTLLPVLRARARAPREPDEIQASGALVIGNPTGDLESAESEAERIATLLDVSPLLSARAGQAEVYSGLEKARVIHIATHATMASEPLDSGFQLADGWLTTRDMLILDMNADLVVLSGCDTGVGYGLTGTELANLAHAVLAGGARSVLVSLWSVDDIATEELMVAFYQAYRDGVDKAEALSRAMDKLRSMDEYRDPWFWGGFVLLGDWE